MKKNTKITNKITFLFNNYKKKIMISIFLIVFCFVLLILNICKYINNKIEFYTNNLIVTLTNNILNSSFNSELFDDGFYNKIYIINYDNNNKIESIDINTAYSNEIINRANKIISNNFSNIDSKTINRFDYLNKNIKVKNNKIILFVSYSLFNNSLFTEFCPKVPITINFNNQITSELTSNIENYGLNNSLIKVSIKTQIINIITVPLFSKEIKVENETPLIIKIIQGDIPNNYIKYDK